MPPAAWFPPAPELPPVNVPCKPPDARPVLAVVVPPVLDAFALPVLPSFVAFSPQPTTNPNADQVKMSKRRMFEFPSKSLDSERLRSRRLMIPTAFGSARSSCKWLGAHQNAVTAVTPRDDAHARRRHRALVHLTLFQRFAWHCQHAASDPRDGRLGPFPR